MAGIITKVKAIKTWVKDIRNNTNFLPKSSSLLSGDDETIKFIKKDLITAGIAGTVFQASQLFPRVAPDILLGFIPLFTVQRYETAFSQDIIKYRAIGGEFLAQQHGGNVAFKAVIYLHRVHGLVWLQMLELLYFLGNEWEKFETQLAAKANYKFAADIFTKAGNGAIFGSNPGESLSFGSSFSSNTLGTNKTIEAANELAKEELDPYDPESYFTAFRFTFPVVTKETIMYSMYIESMINEVDVEFGDWMKVSLLLRQYNAPPGINWAKTMKYKAIPGTPSSGARVLTEGLTISNKYTYKYMQEKPVGGGPWTHHWEQPTVGKVVMPVVKMTRNDSWISAARWTMNGAHRALTLLQDEIKKHGKSSYEVRYPSLIAAISGNSGNNGDDKQITLTAIEAPPLASTLTTGTHYVWKNSEFIVKSTQFPVPSSTYDIQILASRNNRNPINLLFGNKTISGKYLKQGKIEFTKNSIMIDSPTLLECEGRYLWFRKNGTTQIICYGGN